MPNNALSILITRPEHQGRVLAKTLSDAGFTSHCAPQFDYQSLASIGQYQQTFANPPDIIIFVSVAAVDYAFQTLPFEQWPSATYLAIGQATKDRLIALNITNVIRPDLQTSEGLLALEVLATPENQRIVIIRGNGGRELIAEQLSQKGAIVSYIESYQRVWRQYPHDIAKQWRKLEINCIVITSNDLLQSVVQLIKIQDNFWQNTCLWIVASERIANNAAALGLKNVICAYGASDQAILKAVHNMELSHDR